MEENGILKLIAFDMDGVLVDFHSSWVWVHRHFGTCNDGSLRKYFDGAIDDEEFIRRDIALWLEQKPRVHISDIVSILSDIPLMNGLRETVRELNDKGVICVILSAGLDILADRLKRDFGFRRSLSNSLKTDEEGYLVGEGVANVRLKDKATPFIEVRRALGVSAEECMSVGNSSIDVSMFGESAAGIAFNPDDPEVIKAADHVIYKKDLREILRYV